MKNNGTNDSKRSPKKMIQSVNECLPNVPIAWDFSWSPPFVCTPSLSKRLIFEVGGVVSSSTWREGVRENISPEERE